MIDMNNFKKLQKEQEEQYDQNLMGIKNSIESNLGVIGGFMELIDTYISKFLKFFLDSVSGSPNEKDKE